MKYFGYGANKTPEMMEAITRNKKLIGESAELKDFELCIQRFNQIPNKILSSAPVAESPRANVKRSWKNVSNFTTYTIRPAQGKKVVGTVWELTSLERELVRDWELVDFGWYKDAVVKLKLLNGQEIEAQTEILGDNQEIDHVVDGVNYPAFLNDLSEFQSVAKQAREKYFNRLT